MKRKGGSPEEKKPATSEGKDQFFEDYEEEARRVGAMSREVRRLSLN